MYTLNKCQCPECSKPAISVIDDNGNITMKPGWCINHDPEPEKTSAKILKFINEHEKIVGLTACEIEIKNADLKNKKFYGCNMQHCSFSNVHSNGMRIRMSMYDNSSFIDCDLINSDIQFSSFAGAKFVHAILTGSNLIHLNFNGANAYQSSLDDCDLYNSRFIKAILINTSMKNCNLKKTVFYESFRDNVSFKYSNTREALVDRNRGGLMGDSDAVLSESDNESQEIL